MPWEDEIVEEIRAIREAHAARFNFDLEAIYRDLKQQEEASHRQIVALPSKRPTTLPNQEH